MIWHVAQGFSLALSNPKGLRYKIPRAFVLVHMEGWLLIKKIFA